MRSEIDAKVNVLTELLNEKRSQRKQTKVRPVLYSALASLGIFGGMSALFVGLVFVVVHGVLSSDVVFNRAGTVLLMVAIPMILVGSMFVDKIDRKDR